MMIEKVALIGSFREANYPKVRAILELFASRGLLVTSPTGTDIISGEEFVRFASDHPAMTNEEIQTETLGKIFSADAVYVVTGTSGYVGKTTCYEIGRIVQRGQPLYFSEMPSDLPVHIPLAHVASPEEFVLRFAQNNETLSGLFESGAGEIFDGERRLTGLAAHAQTAEAFPTPSGDMR